MNLGRSYHLNCLPCRVLLHIAQCCSLVLVLIWLLPVNAYCAALTVLDGDPIQVRILAPSVDSAILNSKMEVGIRLPERISHEADRFFREPLFKTGLNPYDPDSLDVYSLFISPSGRTIRINAFFYRDYIPDSCTRRRLPCWREQPTMYPWRIRFAPPETGQWRFKVFVRTRGGESVQSPETSFTCVNSGNPGFLGTDGRNLVFGQTGEVFPVIGMNTDWYRWGYVNPAISQQYRNIFSELNRYGANTASLAMINRTGLQIEWEYLGVYEYPEAPVNSAEYLANRQAHAWEIDQIFDYADEFNIYLKFNLLQHADFGPDFWNWPQNPYHRYIPTVKEPVDFFADSTARLYFLKKLRYITARWGYSTHIAWYELVTEIDNISTQESGDRLVLDWFQQVAAALKELDNNNHLVAGSYATHFTGNDPSSWVWTSPDCGMINLHHYGENKRTNFDRFHSLNKVRARVGDKPVIFGEMGAYPEPVVDAATSQQFHNNLWATFMMESAGTGLNWHWETLISNGYLHHFKPLSDFAAMIDRRELSDSRRFPLFHGVTFRGRHYRVESFYRVSTNKESACGWVLNASAYWYNLGLPAVFNQAGQRVKPTDDDRWEGVITRERDYARVSGLKRVSWYCMTPYLIREQQLESAVKTSLRTNLFGQAKIRVFRYFRDSNDFAYIIRPGKCDCKQEVPGSE